MLRIKNLKKTFGSDNFITKAVDNISVEFRQTEFVCVLGPSGCGKSTFLNLIGALDKPNSGEISLYENPFSKFSDVELDQYRNNSVGFIFQTHNLIKHLNVLENVEMGMSLSGVGSKERKKIALNLIKEVGLLDHAYKKPNELSVGQGQRIAIARAIANNPDIILADEPTGSVDSDTAVQIMDLLTKVSKGKLVIMVTHDEELAEKYATRIIRLSDGKLISDSNPYQSTRSKKRKKELNLKKTFISFKTSFISALKNLKYKLGRTLSTSLASSIGIIGISLTLALAIGTNREIKHFENDVLGHYPVNISSNYQISYTQQIPIPELPEIEDIVNEPPVEPNQNEIITKVENKITDDYVNFILDYYHANPDNFSGILIKPKLKVSILNYQIDDAGEKYFTTQYDSIIGVGTPPVRQPLITTTFLPEGEIFDLAYEYIAGDKPETGHDPETNTFGIVLIVNKYNEFSAHLLNKLEIDYELHEELPYEKIIGKELILNAQTYTKYVPENAITLKITGIVRLKDNGIFTIYYEGIGIPQEVTDYLKINHPDRVYSPDYINLYPSSLDAKKEIKAYLDTYNESRGFDDKHPNFIIYNDESATLQTMSRTALDAAGLGLLGFSFISLIVSSVMIAIITYTSVVERTKEIGILRSLGARKKDIARIFNSENIIIGVFSGILGIIIPHILSRPLNRIIEIFVKMKDVIQIHPTIDILMLILSIVIAYIAGFIPSRMAANKNPVDALREI